MSEKWVIGRTDRPRQWKATFMGGVEGIVQVRHMAITEPGEDLTEYPPYVTMDAGDWAEHHADFGLALDGSPLSTEVEAATSPRCTEHEPGCPGTRPDCRVE